MSLWWFLSLCSACLSLISSPGLALLLHSSPSLTSARSADERASRRFTIIPKRRFVFSSSSSSSSSDLPSSSVATATEKSQQKNAKYIEGLLGNLSEVVDKWMINGSPNMRTQAQNIITQIQRESLDQQLVDQAFRIVQRAGMPPPLVEKRESSSSSSSSSSSKELGKTDAKQRKQEVKARQQWEASRTNQPKQETATANNASNDDNMSNYTPRIIAKEKTELDNILRPDSSQEQESADATTFPNGNSDDGRVLMAATKVSSLIARSGAGSSFDGETLGIGGLDDVLSQVKRRIWIPLAAGPVLLAELGINPVRGLLLYGMPGCGKTLLAQRLGRILSPMRPMTVVSGPEIMDKFVGSSEKNLRAVFDNPPDIYDSYRIGETDGGEAIAKAALHVIIMDEFDAIARTRGGRGGKGDQGDAGVARDSVVNQLLAKMDGVDPLIVPTLVIGLTNRRSLVEPALLRPGRFEVQIEVPPPKTLKQRISILKIHTNNMYRSGRIKIRDPPSGTAAARFIESNGMVGLLTYDELLRVVAEKCEGMSGASLAGVARAAASHALERAVEDFSANIENGTNRHNEVSMLDCLVMEDDFTAAIEDVIASTGDSDWAEESEMRTDAPEKSDDKEP